MQRRLAAILFADVAGYSRLMGADEAGTLAALKAHRAEIDEEVTARAGRIVKTTGDGVLIEFPSVVAAVEAAVAMQSAAARRNTEELDARRQHWRVGIHLGDVIVDGDDIYGDGVNIAARLHELAEPGGIALSRIVADSVRGKVAAALVDAGEQALKNIAAPLQVFRIAPVVAPPLIAALPLPDKPSIAVLPFANMSGDAEQEYFADGITEDIITELSRFGSLFVIARNSSFTYKGKAVDVKRVGQELGVRYVLEGSVRKAASRVRITGQLIDAQTGAHLWAERFDGTLEDIFDLQDQVTARVVSELMASLEQAEIERARRKPTASLDAYDYCLRAKAAARGKTRAGVEEALALARRAIEHDPQYGGAYALAAWYHAVRAGWGWRARGPEEDAEPERLARRAEQLAPEDAAVLGMTGFTLAYVARDLDAASALLSRALAKGPNLSANWAYSAWIHVWKGDPRTSIEHARKALRLSPVDPEIDFVRGVLAHAFYFLGDFTASAALAQENLQLRREHAPTLRVGAAALAMAGHPDEATKLLERLRAVDPDLTVARLPARLGPYRRAEDVARYAEGLRRAGLPE